MKEFFSLTHSDGVVETRRDIEEITQRVKDLGNFPHFSLVNHALSEWDLSEWVSKAPEQIFSKIAPSILDSG